MHRGWHTQATACQAASPHNRKRHRTSLAGGTCTGAARMRSSLRQPDDFDRPRPWQATTQALTLRLGAHPGWPSARQPANPTLLHRGEWQQHPRGHQSCVAAAVQSSQSDSSRPVTACRLKSRDWRGSAMELSPRATIRPVREHGITGGGKCAAAGQADLRHSPKPQHEDAGKIIDRSSNNPNRHGTVRCHIAAGGGRRRKPRQDAVDAWMDINRPWPCGRENQNTRGAKSHPSAAQQHQEKGWQGQRGRQRSRLGAHCNVCRK